MVGNRVSVVFDLVKLTGTEDDPMMAMGGDVESVLREHAVHEDKHLVHLSEQPSWEEAATITCAGCIAWSALNGLKSVSTKPRSALMQSS